MDERISKVIVFFQNNGWEVIGSADVMQDWWFEDIIVLQSVWSPVGKKLYLALLTDPAELGQKIVWCISISAVLPEYEDYNSVIQITLNDIKKTNLENLVGEVNKKVLK